MQVDDARLHNINRPPEPWSLAPCRPTDIIVRPCARPSPVLTSFSDDCGQVVSWSASFAGLWECRAVADASAVQTHYMEDADWQNIDDYGVLRC